MKEGPRASTFSLGLMFSRRKEVSDMNIGKRGERLSHVFYYVQQEAEVFEPGNQKLLINEAAA